MSRDSKEEPPGKRRLHRLVGAICLRPRDSRGLVALLRRASRDGVLDGDLLTMIEGVFSVGDMCVRDIMVPRPQMKIIRKDATPAQVLKSVTDGSHSRFPVVGDDPDRIEGVLHAKDLLGFFSSGEARIDVAGHLRPPVIVPESKRLKVLLEEFRKNRNHMAIVVDEYGGVSGLVTIEDVLEQIVGDITDEYDVDEDSYIFVHRGGQCRVKALTPIEDFNGHFKSELSNGSASTIGGLVVKAFGHLPKRGDTIEIAPFTFEVTHADDRRVHSLLVRKKA